MSCQNLVIIRQETNHVAARGMLSLSPLPSIYRLLQFPSHYSHHQAQAGHSRQHQLDTGHAGIYHLP